MSNANLLCCSRDGRFLDSRIQIAVIATTFMSFRLSFQLVKSKKEVLIICTDIVRTTNKTTRRLENGAYLVHFLFINSSVVVAHASIA